VGWLTSRLSEPGTLVLPGAYDAYSALLVERAGFEAVYASGYAAAASGYGLPDLGLLGLAEIAEAHGRIAAAVAIPVLADIDTGYGGSLNVARAVREMARRGITAVQVEDQVNPKRCGHLDDKQVADVAESAARIVAAVSAGDEAGVDVVARTDALAVGGMDEAVYRAGLFAACGAAAVLIDAPPSADAVVELRGACPDRSSTTPWTPGRPPGSPWPSCRRSATTP
jgi:2-methylisocitrate lyase-like PEP mutase family enzyme